MKFAQSRFCQTLAVLFLMLAALTGTHAQTTYGSVRGLVKDSQGGVIPGATATLTNLGTKEVVRTGTTNGVGEFEFASIVPGNYVVEVALKGFKTIKETLTVELGVTASFDATLPVGSTGETIEVQAAEALIDTASASGGQTFTTQQLTELPNLGRNPFVFELLDNNVTPVGDPRYVRAEDQSGSSAVSISGAPIGSNSYVVDGIPTSTSSGGVTFIPSPDAVSEAKTQGNTYDAEVGRTGGGVGNVTMKSGDSVYHGVLYGETRQTAWSANSWLNKHTNYLVDGVLQGPVTPRPDVTTYLYAGAFGGPVPFSNKVRFLRETYFYVTEEGYRQAQPLTGTGQLVVPTAAEAAGDFSGDPIKLYDPTSPFVGGVRTTPLMGIKNGLATANIIPAAYLNPIGSWIAANAYPSQTNPANNGVYGNFNSQRADDFKTRSDMYSGKLDHVFFPWWHSSASYVHLATQEPSGDFYGNKGNFSSDGKLVRFNDATSFYNVFTVNPTTIATVGYGFNRYYSVTFPYGLGFNLSNGFGGAGFPSGFVSAVQSNFGGKGTFPTITATQNSVGSFASLGSGYGGRSIPSASHNFVLGIQKTVGKQNLKAGYVYRALHVASNPVGTNPAFNFGGNYTSVDGLSSSADTTSTKTGATNGSGLADLEMGLPAGTASSTNPYSAYMGEAQGAFNEVAGYHAVYLQDDFRANDKLTVNLGLRYEYELGERELNNQLTVGFNPNIAYTIPTTTVGGTTEGGATFHGGLEYAGVNGAPIHTANQSHTKFSPRVGIAYEFKKGTVLQAGFGSFYGPEAVAAFNAGYTQTSSYVAGTGGNITAPLTAAQLGSGAFLSNPFNGTTTGSIIPPSGNALGYYTALGSTISVVDHKRTDPLVEQYSVALEHELPWQTSIKIGYVGAHSKNFPLAVNINQLSDGLYAQLAACAAGTAGSCPAGSTATTNYSSKAASNPYYLPSVTANGVTYATGSSAATSTTSPAIGQLLLPYPQYSTVTLSEGAGYSLYNAFNLKVVKRASRGLTLTFAYTWASNWDNLYGGGSTLNGTSGPQDNYNLKGEYSRAVNDIPNRIAASVLYDIPVGRGQRFLGGMPRWLDYAVGGFKVDAIIKRQDGGPLGITQGTNLGATFGVSGFGGSAIRPNLNGTNPCYSGKPEDVIAQHGFYFNPTAFTAAPAFTYGNVSRSIGCKGPGLSDIDLNLAKTFSITERVKVRFIAEALNVTNTPQFSVSGLSLATAKPSTPGGAIAPFAGTAGTTGALSQINYNRFIQLGGRIMF